MGVFLRCHRTCPTDVSLPHARGGVSTRKSNIFDGEVSSPRPWGCFRQFYTSHVSQGVFPTPVGVFPIRYQLFISLRCLPHARGGVSLSDFISPVFLSSSPRPWGCFSYFSPNFASGAVFPTPVGVFLQPAPKPPRLSRLPHARGGVSVGLRECPVRAWSSPRPWGCFSNKIPVVAKAIVFPTPVGVFLRLHLSSPATFGLPHARGGVSPLVTAGAHDTESSPRPWGCFWAFSLMWVDTVVFPTPVGVFLIFFAEFRQRRSLPHARGGVSHKTDIAFFQL